jgi:hypothetical protein
MFFNLGDSYEINGKDFISNRKNTKKIIFKDLVLQNRIHNKPAKEN